MQAFEELIARHERKAYNLAYRLMGNQADAADTLQNSLVRTFTHLHSFQGNSTFWSWLCRIVTNACLDELRRRRRTNHASLDQTLELEDGAHTRQIAAEAAGPEELLERRETQAAVQAAINQLAPELRAVLVLRDLQGYRYHEIEVITGWSLGMVKSRLNRARQALKSKLLQTGINAAPNDHRGPGIRPFHRSAAGRTATG